MHIEVSLQVWRLEAAVDIAVAVVVASGGALAHIAGSWVEACCVAVAVDTALAETGDILEASASAWEGTEDNHVVGSHLAAAAAAAVVAEEAHMECIGRSGGCLDRPGAASCIVDPWRKRLIQRTSPGVKVCRLHRGQRRGVNARTCNGQSRTWVIANARQVIQRLLASRRALVNHQMQTSE
jgi:hypothetical protein